MDIFLWRQMVALTSSAPQYVLPYGRPVRSKSFTSVKFMLAVLVRNASVGF